MTKEEIVALLQTGDFTIAYHDNSYCCLYKGKFDYDDLPEQEDASFDHDNFLGYAPEIVCHLVNALKGRIDSI